jgi:hypothetical protein
MQSVPMRTFLDVGAGGGYMLPVDIRGTERTVKHFLLFLRIGVLFWLCDISHFYPSLRR